MHTEDSTALETGRWDVVVAMMTEPQRHARAVSSSLALWPASLVRTHTDAGVRTRRWQKAAEARDVPAQRDENVADDVAS